MRRLQILAATLSLTALLPSLAQARTYVRYHLLPYEFSYNHNYGPGPLPGTFAYYDGPSTIACRQSAAAYLGQNRHRNPCN